jgi:hypothetical protein
MDVGKERGQDAEALPAYGYNVAETMPNARI